MSDQPTVASGSRFLQYMPQYHCPRCESAVPAECVRGEMVPTTYEPQEVRIVRVYCPHCNELFEGRFVLAGGLLQLQDGPHVVGDARVRRRLLKEIGLVRGDVQLQAC